MAPSSTVASATRWSLILRAQGQGEDARTALHELIRHYERYVVWLIRQRRHPPDKSAEELKQAFLEGVLRRNDFAKLERERGSFRGWLDKAVRRFLSNEWRNWYAPGSGRQGTVHGEVDPEQLGALPEDVCMREFANHVVTRALALQRAESRDAQRFDALARFLPGPQMEPVELASLGASLGMTPNALAKSICLMRSRFRELLREAIRDLLDLERGPEPPDGSPAHDASRRAIEDELRELRRHFWS